MSSSPSPVKGSSPLSSPAKVDLLPRLSRHLDGCTSCRRQFFEEREDDRPTLSENPTAISFLHRMIEIKQVRNRVQAYYDAYPTYGDRSYFGSCMYAELQAKHRALDDIETYAKPLRKRMDGMSDDLAISITDTPSEVYSVADARRCQSIAEHVVPHNYKGFSR